MGDIVRTVLIGIAWFFIALAILILAFPIGILCVIIFHDWEQLRFPTIVWVAALDIMLLGELTKQHTAPPKWYHPPWRKGSWLRKRYS